MAPKKPIGPGSFVPRRFFSIIKSNFTRGNMIQLAIAFILGTAFNAVVASLANDIILQAIYKAVPALGELSKEGSVGINYGKFLVTLIIFILDVILISVLMYVIVITMEFINRNKPKPVPPPPMASNNDLLAELKLLNSNIGLLASTRHTSTDK